MRAVSSAKPARRCDNADLGELAAYAVQQLRVLLDQQLARGFEPARRLLFDAL